MATVSTTLRIKSKRLFDSIHNEKIKRNILQAIPFWTASLITGLFAVLYAKAFAYAEEMGLAVFHWHTWSLFIVAPICFISAWWVVKKFAPNAVGSGIPQVMAAIELTAPRHKEKIKKLLSLRIIVIKVVSSMIFIFGGAVVGREGPTIQIAASVFRKIDELLPKWWPKVSMRNMIMTGSAAGLAAAFNTPLGGIVFAVEELTKMHISYFKKAIFTAVIIAGLTAQGLAGPYLYLGYPAIDVLSKYIILAVIAVAVIAGLLGSGMAKIILMIYKWKAKFRFDWQHILYLIFCSLVIASLAFFVSESMLGSGKNIMTHTLFTADKYSPWYLPILRIIGSIFSFTAGGAGGVFAPGLAAGASVGSMISGWFTLSPSDTNLLILSGMVAFLTGITRSPFTSAILVLEMTDRHSLIFHLLIAGMIASFVSIIIDKHSFYEHRKDFFMKRVLGEGETAETDEEENL